MAYTIAEVAEQLNISKVSIYKKLKQFNQELKPFLTVKNGVKYLDNKGIEILKNSVVIFNQEEPQVKSELKENTSIEGVEDVLTGLKELKELKDKLINQVKNNNEKLFISGDSELLTTLQQQLKEKHEYIKLLQCQLEVKDKQIDELSRALSQSQKINENSQVLLRESQQKMLLQKNFWSRIFKN